MLPFRSLLLHVSRSPIYWSPSSKFLSQSLYKGRDAGFPKPALTCLWEFLVKELPFYVLLTEYQCREREMLHCRSLLLRTYLSQSPVESPLSRFPRRALIGTDAPLTEPPLPASKSPRQRSPPLNFTPIGRVVFKRRLV
jgi:hypothetical protein